jgi:hypothetical protein
MKVKTSGEEKEIGLCTRTVNLWRTCEKYREPKHVYISKLIDTDRNSDMYGQQVLTKYRFVHSDGYEVCFRVPIDVYNPFIDLNGKRK